VEHDIYCPILGNIARSLQTQKQGQSKCQATGKICRGTIKHQESFLQIVQDLQTLSESTSSAGTGQHEQEVLHVIPRLSIEGCAAAAQLQMVDFCAQQECMPCM
jgi:hypothetical protein